MPAKSEKQRRLMGMVYAAKKDPSKYDSLSPEAKKIYNSMTKEQLKDYVKKGTDFNNSYYNVISKHALLGRAMRNPRARGLLTPGLGGPRPSGGILPLSPRNIKPPQIKIPALPRPKKPTSR